MGLSEAQHTALRDMADMQSGILHVSILSPGSWLRTCKGLERRGFAERAKSELENYHAWRITDAGRAALAQEQGDA